MSQSSAKSEESETKLSESQEQLEAIRKEMIKLEAERAGLVKQLEWLMRIRFYRPIFIYIVTVVISFIVFACVYKDLNEESIPHLIILLVGILGYLSLLFMGIYIWHAHETKEREYAHLAQLEQDAREEREALRQNQPAATTAGNNQSVEIKDLVTLFKALEINDTKKTNEKEKEQINRIRREILKQIQDLTERVFEEIN